MTPAILIVNKPSKPVETYRKFLAGKGYRVFTTPTLVEADILLHQTPCSLAFINSDLLDGADLSVIRNMKDRSRDCKFVLMAMTFDMDSYIEALHGSIFHEYLLAPMNLSLLENVAYHLIHLDEEPSLFPPMSQTAHF